MIGLDKKMNVPCSHFENNTLKSQKNTKDVQFRAATTDC